LPYPLLLPTPLLQGHLSNTFPLGKSLNQVVTAPRCSSPPNTLLVCLFGTHHATSLILFDPPFYLFSTGPHEESLRVILSLLFGFSDFATLAATNEGPSSSARIVWRFPPVMFFRFDPNPGVTAASGTTPHTSHNIVSRHGRPLFLPFGFHSFNGFFSTGHVLVVRTPPV